MKRTRLLTVLAVFAVSMVLAESDPAKTSSQAEQTKKRIERADQLPIHTYQITVKPSAILADDTAALQLMNALEADIKKDLAEYEIQDKATLKLYYSYLATSSIQSQRYGEALEYLDRLRDLEDKPALALMSGVFERALISAKKAKPSEYLSTFKAEFDKAISALPYDVVQAELKTLKSTCEIYSRNLLIGMVEEQIDPAGKSGSISKDIALNVLNARLTLLYLIPLKDVIIESVANVIAAHNFDKADIWKERDVVLSSDEKLTPVVVGIWDTGIDISLFPGRTFVNPNETAGNNIDDDNNGYVDDVYGIGWSAKWEKNIGPLRTVNATKEEMENYKRVAKGFLDLQAGIDSPEASDLRKQMAGLAKEEVTPFVEGLQMYGSYSHGTHVAGIASKGNPAIRVLVARMDFPYGLLPPLPTLDEVNKFAILLRETVNYFKLQGVRVVNISWSYYTPKDYENVLELHNAGGTPAERKALARKFFDICNSAFRSALADAAEILFICAAGNSGSDVRFDEMIPSSYDLPNVMSIGATDKAGDEAAFTSFGKVDLYANGYEVESVVPGGDRQSWSGTSMAAPQAVNLAAKLLAAYPELTTAQVRALVIDGCDSKTISENRKILLLNEKKSFELAQKRYAIRTR